MTQQAEKKPADSRTEGFTLIEVMVAILILGVAIAVGATAFARRNSSLPPVVVARQMQASLLRARHDSILSGTETAFSFDIEKRTYTYPPGSEPHELPAGMTLQMTTSREFQTGNGQYTLRFNPDGSCSGSKIVLSYDHGANATIEVHWLTGMPRVISGNDK